MAFPCAESLTTPQKVISANSYKRDEESPLVIRFLSPNPDKWLTEQSRKFLAQAQVVDLDLTQPKENRFLASYHKAGGHYGFAYLDMTTGEFRLTESTDLRGIQDELLRLQPKELLHPADTEQPQLPEGVNPVLTAYDDWVFEYEFAHSQSL